MSYDYDAIVSSIRKLRAEAYGFNLNTSSTANNGTDADVDVDATATTNENQSSPTVRKKVRVEPLSRAVEEYVRLSGHCPLPPKLWMHYATDASLVMDLLLQEDDDGGGEERMDVDGDDDGEDGEGEAGAGKTKKAGDGDGGASASAQATQVKLDVLETSISTEMWPGCARLRLEHLRTLLQLHDTSSGDDDAEAGGDRSAAVPAVVVVDDERMRDAFEDAIHWVGMGTHRSDVDVADMWRMYATWTADRVPSSSDEGKNEESESASASASARDVAEIYARRSRVPLESNDSLTEEIREMESKYTNLGSLMDIPVEGHSNLAEAIEVGRSRTAKLFDRYASNEADVRSNMHAEGILQSEDDDGAEGDNERYLMGLGGIGTASAFVAYAKSLSTKGAVRSIGYDLSVRMYERGVSECPTVEDLWIPYVNSLLRTRYGDGDEGEEGEAGERTIASNGQMSQQPKMTTAIGVAERACKNCPYSSRLHALRMRCIVASSATNPSSTFDGDAIVAVAREAIDAGFLPTAESRLEVHMEACRVIRRHLMRTVCDEYDEPIPTPVAKSAKGKKGGDEDGDGGGDGDGREEGEEELDGEEVGFIVEDLRDAYDAAEEYVRTTYPKWGEGSRLVWHDRALTEDRVIRPALALAACIGESTAAATNGDAERANGDGGDGGNIVDEATRYFEKSVKTYPNVARSWMEYASFLTATSSGPPTSPPPTGRRRRGDMAYRGLRRARDVYRRGVGASSVNDGRFANLCDAFVSFERSYGSYDNLARATGMTKAKMRRYRQKQQQAEDEKPTSTTTVVEVEAEMEVEGERRGTKRKAEEDDASPDDPHPDGEDLDGGGDRKKAKVDHHGGGAVDGTPVGTASGASAAEGEKSKKPTNLKVEESDPDRRHSKHVVRIGRMEYPAHPYTVRVSNLSPSTQDMDLVDAFKRCGRIVHARILREKHCGPGYKGGGGDGDEDDHHHHQVKRGKSKGCGLVQFEERESVETALSMNEEIGIDERLVRVERSNIPASFVVPPGMHRVNPRGRGKHTKKNVKIREAQKQHDQVAEAKDDATSSTAEGKATGRTDDAAGPKPSEPDNDRGEAPSRAEVLAFRPRGLAHPRRRVKLDVVARRSTPEKAPDGTSKPG